jgi:hypothetical protein
VSRRTLEPSATFAVPESVLSREVGGETVILDTVGGTYYGLDEVGTRIWDLVRDGRSVEAVETVLLDEYEVEPDDLHRDLERLLDELLDQGLLVSAAT